MLKNYCACRFLVCGAHRTIRTTPLLDQNSTRSRRFSTPCLALPPTRIFHEYAPEDARRSAAGLAKWPILLHYKSRFLKNLLKNMSFARAYFFFYFSYSSPKAVKSGKRS
ncbi:hypothetical protein [Paraherbaspirillum soli]|uniref:Uncharacterized protein n=1 Tax=Paraherbaspirillum soli TaxID=631222 RepID=A0ABW0M935_9BURK